MKIIFDFETDIAKALEWMHSNGFIHDDLAGSLVSKRLIDKFHRFQLMFAIFSVCTFTLARNCLVANAAGKVILGDYGLGPKLYPRDYHKVSNHLLPIRWISPESFEFGDGTCNPLQV